MKNVKVTGGGGGGGGSSTGRATASSRGRVTAEVGGFLYIFFSPCHLSVLSIRSIPVLPQWYVKDHNHSAKSAGGTRRVAMA